MTPEIQAEIKRLQRLKQYANSDDNSLVKIAERNLVLVDLVDSGNFIDDAEKKEAEKIFKNYLSKLDFENYSDLSTLSILTYNQILLQRVQKTINASTTKDGKTFINKELVKTLNDLTNQILDLKMKLGIDAEKTQDEMTAFQLLKKRFHQYIQENKSEFTMWIPYTCSGCGKEDVESHLFRFRTANYDAFKHPFFSGRFYYNAEMIKDVEAGLITKEQAARYLKTSVDYIIWCLENKGRILSKEE